ILRLSRPRSLTLEAHEVARSARALPDADRSVADGEQSVRVPAPAGRAVAVPPLVERATQFPASERLVDERDLLYPHRRRVRLNGPPHGSASERHLAARAQPEEADHAEHNPSGQSETPSGLIIGRPPFLIPFAPCGVPRRAPTKSAN